MIPDLVAADGFVFVSPQQREAFLATPWTSRAKKAQAPVIPIGPNIMPARIDPRARRAPSARSCAGKALVGADLVVGFFGVLYASKRPDLLLRATQRAARARRQGAAAGLRRFSLGQAAATATLSLRSPTNSACAIGSTSAAASTTRAS